MDYKNLKVGDVRQDGDESRRVPHEAASWTTCYDDEWHPVSLVGEPILRSDLMHLQFRRPV